RGELAHLPRLLCQPALFHADPDHATKRRPSAIEVGAPDAVAREIPDHAPRHRRRHVLHRSAEHRGRARPRYRTPLLELRAQAPGTNLSLLRPREPRYRLS